MGEAVSTPVTSWIKRFFSPKNVLLVHKNVSQQSFIIKVLHFKWRWIGRTVVLSQLTLRCTVNIGLILWSNASERQAVTNAFTVGWFIRMLSSVYSCPLAVKNWLMQLFSGIVWNSVGKTGRSKQHLSIELNQFISIPCGTSLSLQPVHQRSPFLYREEVWEGTGSFKIKVIHHYLLFSYLADTFI